MLLVNAKYFHFFFFRAQSDLSQNNSYSNDIAYSNSGLQDNHSSNSSAQCSEKPVLVSQTKKHQTTQQVTKYLFYYKDINFKLKLNSAYCSI